MVSIGRIAVKQQFIYLITEVMAYWWYTTLQGFDCLHVEGDLGLDELFGKTRKRNARLHRA